MENKKLIPNSTQIPNIILDLLLPDLPEAEARCLLYICRRTYGFHKDEDRISFSQFLNGIKDKKGKVLDKGCGLKARASVCEGLKNLKKAGAIFVRKDSRGNFYKINLEMDTDKVVQEIDRFRKQTASSSRNRPKQVRLLNLQKKGNKEKQRKGDQSSPNHISILRNYFIEKCKKEKGFEPEMAFGKEGGLLREKLKRFSVEKLKDLIDKFFNSKIGEDLGYTLSICLSSVVINQWQAGKLEKAKKPFYRGDPMAQKNGKWFVIVNNEWLTFAGKESEISWK